MSDWDNPEKEQGRVPFSSRNSGSIIDLASSPRDAKGKVVQAMLRLLYPRRAGISYSEIVNIYLQSLAGSPSSLTRCFQNCRTAASKHSSASTRANYAVPDFGSPVAVNDIPFTSFVCFATTNRC